MFRLWGGGPGEERGGERKKKERGRRRKGSRKGGDWGVSRSQLESIIKSVTVTFLWEKQSDITKVRACHSVLRLWNVVRGSVFRLSQPISYNMLNNFTTILRDLSISVHAVSPLTFPPLFLRVECVVTVR